jgi:hypothetical protein
MDIPEMNIAAYMFDGKESTQLDKGKNNHEVYNKVKYLSGISSRSMI